MTTDNQSPGARRVQRYSVAGGLSGSKANQETTPVEFVKLVNCLVDKRLGAVVKRPGSVQETISGALGTPLGIAEYYSASASTLIPIRRVMLANFSGNEWRQNQAGTWSSVSVDSGLSLSSSKPSTFTQIGSRLYIAAGEPAYWDGPGTTIKPLGIPAPTSALTITSSNTGSGITLTSGTSYMATCYNSTTGAESDWSPISSAVGAISNKSIVIALPATAAGEWDQFRIYRYLDGGAYPYLVDTVSAATTSYTDSKPDAQLTSRASARYKKGLPPTQAFVCANYSQHLWFVDATDPYKLCFSEPYTGSNVDPSYFPLENTVRSSEPITALLVTSSRLLIFHPRSISVLTGSSKDEFDIDPLIPGIGTVFPQSVSTNGTDIVFLSEQGFVSITFGGGSRIHLSREIDLDLQPLLAGSYNAFIYASSVWSPSLRQFIFCISARSAATVGWVDATSGLTATWVDTLSAISKAWESTDLAAQTTNRVKIWGWSPELSNAQGNLWAEYAFPVATDSNTNNAFVTTMCHPAPSSDSNDPQQDKTYIGYYTGTAGGIISAFRKDTNTDNGTPITSEIITGRICPGDQQAAFKLFQSLGFHNAYSDPTSDTLGSLSYLIDFDDPHLRGYEDFDIPLAGSTDQKKFSTMQGRHIHLRLVDTSQSQSKVLLSEFFITYRERMRRSGR